MRNAACSYIHKIQKKPCTMVERRQMGDFSSHPSHSLFHSFSLNFLRTYYMPGTAHSLRNIHANGTASPVFSEWQIGKHLYITLGEVTRSRTNHQGRRGRCTLRDGATDGESGWDTALPSRTLQPVGRWLKSLGLKRSLTEGKQCTIKRCGWSVIREWKGSNITKEHKEHWNDSNKCVSTYLILATILWNGTYFLIFLNEESKAQKN